MGKKRGRTFTDAERKKAVAVRRADYQHKVRRAHQLLAQGLVPKEIAKKLGVKTPQVRKYLKTESPQETPQC